MSKSAMQVEVIGQLWFRNAAQYADYLAVFEDADRLPATFSRWHKLATQAREDLLRSGKVAVQVYASVDEFVAYCGSRKVRLDAAARIDFAAVKAIEKYRHAHTAKADH
jgi:hypothetical protein